MALSYLCSAVCSRFTYVSGGITDKIHNENNESAFGLIAIKLECSSTRRLHGLQQEAVHGRSRGGLTSKIHAVVDGCGLPARLALTTGEAHDNRLAREALIPP